MSGQHHQLKPINGRSLRTPTELVETGLVAAEDLAAIDAVAERYAIAISPTMAALIDRNDPNDPIARQFVPDPAELKVTPEEREGSHRRSRAQSGRGHHPPLSRPGAAQSRPGLLPLLLAPRDGGSAGAQHPPDRGHDEAFACIAGHPEIGEVILTGREPLMLSPRRLGKIMRRLAAIDHVKIVRFHTRVRVVEPERIDEILVAALKASGKVIYVALHANHPRELTAAALAACARLVDAGIAMISPSVLLHARHLGHGKAMIGPGAIRQVEKAAMWSQT